MKKIFTTSFLFILLNLVAFSLYSQHHIFVKVGANLSGNVPLGDLNALSSHRLGVQVGVGDRFLIDERFNLITELLIITKGYKSLLMPDSRNIFYYINLPVQLGYTVGLFNFQLGPEMGYMIGYDVGINNVDVSTRFNRSIDYDRFDASIAGGITFQASERFGISGRYVWGLIATHSGIGNSYPLFNFYSFQNRSIQLSLNYKIN